MSADGVEIEDSIARGREVGRGADQAREGGNGWPRAGVERDDNGWTCRNAPPKVAKQVKRTVEGEERRKRGPRSAGSAGRGARCARCHSTNRNVDGGGLRKDVSAGQEKDGSRSGAQVRERNATYARFERQGARESAGAQCLGSIDERKGLDEAGGMGGCPRGTAGKTSGRARMGAHPQARWRSSQTVTSLHGPGETRGEMRSESMMVE
jgi:hypothetical protein